MSKRDWQKGVLLLLISMFLLAGCMGKNVETPEQAVTRALGAVKNLDRETIRKYFLTEDLISNTENDIIEDQENLKLLLNKLEFKIVSSSKEENIAIVKTEVTNVSFESIFNEFIQQSMTMALTAAFTGQSEPSDEEMNKVFIDLLKKEDREMVTSVVDIKLLKKDSSWIIETDEALQSAVFGGMRSISAINDIPEAVAKQVLVAKKGQVVVIDDFCELSIDGIKFAKKIIPPNPSGYYSYYEAKDEGTTYIDLIITVKSLLTTGKRAEDFASVKIIYNDKYEYKSFSIIEERGGSDFTYTSITPIEPLKKGTLHFLATIPDEVVDGTEPIIAIITIDDKEIHYKIR